MENKILGVVNNPEKMEALYQSDKSAFADAFEKIYEQYNYLEAMKIWHARLNFQSTTPKIFKSTVRSEVLLIAILSLLSGVIAKIPAFLNFKEEFFYPRNVGFISLPILCGFYLWKGNAKIKFWVISFTALILSCLYINLLPVNNKSDSIILACVHLPLFIWSIFGISYTSNSFRSDEKRMQYLKFNGDLLVLCTIILIAGGILTGVTIALFSLISSRFSEYYMKYVVVLGLSSVPIVGAYIIESRKAVMSQISEIIAKIFSPLVLFTLTLYLIATIAAGKTPYTDRDFLITFNFMLVGVMALTVFSLSGGKGLLRIN